MLSDERQRGPAGTCRFTKGPVIALCDRIASRFIHHHPTGPGDDGPPVAATMRALEGTGLDVDLELWTCQVRCRKCKKCHGNDNDDCGTYESVTG